MRTPGKRIDELERLVHEAWEKLVPQLEALDEDILMAYLEAGGPVSPYRIAKSLNVNTTSVYRRSRRLLDWRLLIPGLRANDNDKMMISVKGCLYLYLRNKIGLEELVGCYSRLWGLDLDPLSLLAALYLIGFEAKRRKLSIKTLTMCMPDEAAVHILRYFKRVVELHEELGVSFGEALDSVAYSLYLDRMAFREALRLAFRALARSVLPVIHTNDHSSVILVSEKGVYPIVVWCRNPCRDYRDTLGVECIRARSTVARVLGLVSKSDRGFGVRLEGRVVG